MEIVLFFKPIIDMLWQYKILDIILLVLSLMIFLLALHKLKKINFIDIIAVNICILFTVSFLKNISGFEIYVKIVSGFIYYFLGRVYYHKEPKVAKLLMLSSIIVVSVNLIMVLIGKGSVEWGNALTLKGLYYFKTDFAAALIQSLIFIYFYKEARNKIVNIVRKIYIFAIIPILIILTNARMYLIILIIIMYIMFQDKKEIRSGVKWKINIKQIFLFSILTLFGIYILSFLTKTVLFEQLGLIGFKFDKLSDLFDSANSQGRNVIWANLINNFFSKSFLEKFIGVDLVSDAMINTLNHNSHNSYLKILFSIGFIGSIFFVLFFYKIVRCMNMVKDRRVFYISVSLLAVYVISGFSTNIIEFTQLTWIPMFYFGVNISKRYIRI